jgi:hypothetical protein
MILFFIKQREDKRVEFEREVSPLNWTGFTGICPISQVQRGVTKTYSSDLLSKTRFLLKKYRKLWQKFYFKSYKV